MSRSDDRMPAAKRLRPGSSLWRFPVVAALACSSAATAQTYSPFPTPPTVVANGSAGTNGKDKSGRGEDGQAGTKGTDIARDLSFKWTGSGATAAVSAISNGGLGGAGGAGTGTVIGADGGRGAIGGTGGAVFVRLNAGSAIDTNSSVAALFVSAQGGAGGKGGNIANRGEAGDPGPGAAGGQVTLNLLLGTSIASSTRNVPALLLTAGGGNGGSAYQSLQSSGHVAGRAGGAGGAGGTISAVLQGTISAQGPGGLALSTGGIGADGASGFSTLGSARGGNGGAGGGGGAITLFDFGSISATGASAPATGSRVIIDGTAVNLSVVGAGLIAESLGGTGGKGGSGNGGFGPGQGGQGGAAGNGGTAAVYQFGGSLTTAGYAEAGLFGQSIGGNGGNGANAGSVFSKTGGSGGLGGSGGSVTALNDDGGFLSTTGDASDAAVAQSVGGGGGYGADVSLTAPIAAVVIGGEGAMGGNGGGASATNGTQSSGAGSVLTTLGADSNGLLAQSIGGGGGIGGNASAVVPGVVSVAVGGAAGSGGNGSYVAASNNGVVQTAGSHSNGLIAQSVGGGGGIGGWGSSLTAGVQFTAATSVGGSGGNGGDGGQSDTNSAGQITTAGDDSFGVLAQSIGGGGGDAGDALTRVFQIYNDPRIPSIVSNVAVGGAGGTGGVGNLVTVGNTGAVLTTGRQADGLYALSVGGGGGDGGDATSLNQSFQSPSVSATVTVGGKGGKGGNGGPVVIQNPGAVITLGEQSSGIVGQSIGGGGGLGGAADSDTGTVTDQSNKVTAQVTLTLGGTGGTAGIGGSVDVTNSGGVLTRGDGAFGMLAQSVGGGGGLGGVGKALGSGGTINVNIGVGGSGGGGGLGGAVSATNSGSILTEGGAAAAVVAQSIGGGGGDGGEAASGGGTDPRTTAASFLTAGLGVGAGTTNEGNGIFALVPSAIAALQSLNELRQVLSAYDSGNTGGAKPPVAGSAKTSITVDVGTGVAGKGGSAGDGGTVTIANSGALQTMGPESSDILAESVGGGGGEGGAANPSAGGLVSQLSSVDVALGIGGVGGSAGGGGAVSVSDSQQLQTGGDLAFGIHAESIGGGGGDGGATIAQNATAGKLTIALGGKGGASGNGGSVAVNLGPNGSINTSGRDASAILAQSVGGGGGLAFLMGTTDPGQGGIGRSGTGLSNGTVIPGSAIVSTVFDGTGGASGTGGMVTVTLDPTAAARGSGIIVTGGTDAYGVMAQSVGGGGGLIIGAHNNAATLSTLFPATETGNGGAVIVTLNHNYSIYTSGSGGVGIVAQSVGGGGGTIGGLDQVDLSQAIHATPKAESGQGGNVSVSLVNGGNIVTNGYRADGIVAQSVGGGGGLLDQPDGTGYAFSGIAPYANCGRGGSSPACSGAVNVTIGGNSVVRALGAQTYAVFVQSRGNGTNNTVVNVQAGGYVEAWGQSAGGIFVSGANTNTINNAGFIDNGTLTGAVTPSGIAITGNAAAVINNTGTINGSVALPTGFSTLNNNVGGVFNAGSLVNLGSSGGLLDNAGTLSPGGVGQIADVVLDGNLVEQPGSTLLLEVSPSSGRSDQVTVNGDAELDGTITIALLPHAQLVPGIDQTQILTATAGVTPALAAAAASGSTPVLAYTVSQPDADHLELTTAIDFAPVGQFAASNLLTTNRAAIGRALNGIEAAETPDFVDIADDIADVPTIQGLARTYDSLSGEAVADAQQVAFSTQHQYQALLSQQIVSNLLPDGDAAVAEHPATTAWLTGFGGSDRLSGDGAASLASQTGGGAVSIARWLGTDTAAGVSAGGSTTHFSVASQTDNGRSTGAHISLFGLRRQGAFYVSGALSYANFAVGETRIGIASLAGIDAAASSAFSDNLFGGRLEAGYRIDTPAATLTPFAAIAADGLWQGSLTEHTSSSEPAAAVALHYDAERAVSVPLAVGLRAQHSTTLGRRKSFTTELQIGWNHEFRQSRSLTADFNGAPSAPFQVDGIRAPRDEAAMQAGAAITWGRGFSVFASSTGQFSGKASAYGGSIGIQQIW